MPNKMLWPHSVSRPKLACTWGQVGWWANHGQCRSSSWLFSCHSVWKTEGVEELFELASQIASLQKQWILRQIKGHTMCSPKVIQCCQCWILPLVFWQVWLQWFMFPNFHCRCLRHPGDLLAQQSMQPESENDSANKWRWMLWCSNCWRMLMNGYQCMGTNSVCGLTMPDRFAGSFADIGKLSM